MDVLTALHVVSPTPAPVSVSNIPVINPGGFDIASSPQSALDVYITMEMKDSTKLVELLEWWEQDRCGKERELGRSEVYQQLNCCEEMLDGGNTYQQSQNAVGLGFIHRQPASISRGKIFPFQSRILFAHAPHSPTFQIGSRKYGRCS